MNRKAPVKAGVFLVYVIERYANVGEQTRCGIHAQYYKEIR